MRYLILSDIHANLEALEAVLATDDVADATLENPICTSPPVSAIKAGPAPL